ncbi:MAG: methyltransferase domain-containing protein [Chloroherpetonaceae bacterium]
MTSTTSSHTRTTREYYNSSDADKFYEIIWGGEDIHIGIYQNEFEPIRDASKRTVETMAKVLSLTNFSTVLDLGAGYGGAARYLAKTFGCKVVALNLSEVENARNRRQNEMAGLSALIDVREGNFEEIPFENKCFDVIWSQDAILHSGEKSRVFSEAARVLKDGGDFLFTDIMQIDDCPEDVLQPILERIHLQSLGSPAQYRALCREFGFREVRFDDRSLQLVAHYKRVLLETNQRQIELMNAGVSLEYIERMKVGLRHWIDGGSRGYLVWGIFHFIKI